MPFVLLREAWRGVRSFIFVVSGERDKVKRREIASRDRARLRVHEHRPSMSLTVSFAARRGPHEEAVVK